jgi:hypothetical protein
MNRFRRFAFTALLQSLPPDKPGAAVHRRPLFPAPPSRP